jgi:hypothetical protein
MDVSFELHPTSYLPSRKLYKYHAVSISEDVFKQQGNYWDKNTNHRNKTVYGYGSVCVELQPRKLDSNESVGKKRKYQLK